MPNARNVVPETTRITSMEMCERNQTPIPIQSAAPIVRANTLPVNTQRALCLAARTRAVRNDLSPIPATATVANAVVKPATVPD